MFKVKNKDAQGKTPISKVWEFLCEDVWNLFRLQSSFMDYFPFLTVLWIVGVDD